MTTAAGKTPTPTGASSTRPPTSTLTMRRCAPRTGRRAAWRVGSPTTCERERAVGAFQRRARNAAAGRLLHCRLRCPCRCAIASACAR
ncbi:hypothetical protein EMIHUDRAFT_453296 [Emiliania huxleyi CCMP1516]|uniref:Uncharacterized protein n=2 Tax=Emiliania huxleyi TaxID=2903 RepID=A0A0D3I911_EMIH1|nr:hypothetical protein EMIHUDRAFT_453296 [Emiliania huxleyi CCMP1516]EOD07746.1 hypothetical protein EMIHUDRAFT_453296 [Emiliania huxleyi CCMP1516]|eukprot:XP_005760175.1 hypothetical protein EMIHUDRAFT_453296 [Emiliania huxleyi CCMP1516]